MVTAKMAQSLFEAHTEEVSYKKKNGLVEEGEVTSVNELVAQDLEIDSKTVSKYRALLNLIPELQELANDKVAWSALSSASTLDEARQRELLRLIEEKHDAENKYPDRNWIIRKSDVMKLEQASGAETQVQPENAETVVKTRVRRKNGAKTVISTSKKLREVLDNDALFKKDQIPIVIETLENLKGSIEKKLEELQSGTK